MSPTFTLIIRQNYLYIRCTIYNSYRTDSFTGLILQTLGQFNVFTLLNGWICLHDVLDSAGS